MLGGMAKRKRRAPSETINLLRVKQGSERAVKRRLKEAGIKGYVPSFLEYPPSGPVEFVLFPSYVFVWATGRWREVARTKGVIQFVRFGEYLASVPESELLKLKALEGPTGYIRLRPRNKFRQGQSVKFGEAGTAVTVTDLLGPNRVEVLLSILGRDVRMPVSEDQLVAA
jgi:transcription antitermination factor NusG